MRNGQDGESDERTNLQRVLEAGHFCVTAEVGPPMSADGDIVRGKAHKLRGLVDAVNVTDNQTAMVRMSSVAASLLALEEGVEPIVQMTCRDRNRIALQSDLLGAYALGLRNLLVLSGDPPSVGNHPDAKHVADVDAVQLLAGLRRLAEEGRFMGGSESKMPPKFYLGATVNPFAEPGPLQLARMEEKIQAGARFIQTQAVYDVDQFAAWMEQARARGLHKAAHILAGVIINRSVRSIEMTANVPGINIPESMIGRMRAAEDTEAEGVEMALETVARLREIEGVAGIHIMAIGWESVVPGFVERAGFLPR